MDKIEVELSQNERTGTQQAVEGLESSSTAGSVQANSTSSLVTVLRLACLVKSHALRAMRSPCLSRRSINARIAVSEIRSALLVLRSRSPAASEMIRPAMFSHKKEVETRIKILCGLKRKKSLAESRRRRRLFRSGTESDVVRLHPDGARRFPSHEKDPGIVVPERRFGRWLPAPVRTGTGLPILSGRNPDATDKNTPELASLGG